MISVRADLREVERRLNHIERRQLPFATALALTRTAQHIQKKTLPRVLPHLFDRPTRFVLRGFFVVPAKKHRLEAVVGIKDERIKVGTPAADVLLPHIVGGPRRAKRHEIALRRMGILRADEYTVPGEEMRLNRFGNLTPSTYSKILADVNQTATGGNDLAAGFGQRTTRRGKKRFFYSPNLRPRGIYERQRRGRGFLRVALLFVRAPQYRARFDFQGISGRAALKRFPLEFARALTRALNTAR